MIKFLCPNGHQLSAPENLAGKPGKCPKCSTAFVVPRPEEDEDLEPPVAEKTAAAAAAAPAAATQAAIGMGSGKGKGTAKDAFVFLCPNGHKLNGPPSLKGKPGQCPHCGAKFRIPADDDLETPAELPADQPSGTPSGAFVFPSLAQGSEPAETYDAVEFEDAPDPPPAEFHALSYILGRLWDRKSEGTELEIFLSEGEIIGPDLYCESLSCREYAVFANIEPDGSYAITVIPWTAVRKVGLRKMPELSPKWFS